MEAAEAAAGYKVYSTPATVCHNVTMDAKRGSGMGEGDSVVATLSGAAVVCISDPLPLAARAQCAKCVETHMRARRLDDVAVVDRLIHGRLTSGVLGGPTSTLLSVDKFLVCTGLYGGVIRGTREWGCSDWPSSSSSSSSRGTTELFCATEYRYTMEGGYFQCNCCEDRCCVPPHPLLQPVSFLSDNAYVCFHCGIALL